jgi:glucose-1-phosphate thymidylyltransferase
MHAFVLAGGFATRLWPLTEQRAKPLLPLAGVPMISHIVAGIPREIPITVSTNAAFADAFHTWRKTHADRDITIAVEETRSDKEKLGALGAVAQWIDRAKVEDDLFLITGDNYFGFPLAEVLAGVRGDHALLAASDIGDRTRARSFGTVLLAEDGRTITGFEEKPAEPKTTLVSTGCSVIPKRLLPTLRAYAAQHPDNVGGIFEELLRRGETIDAFVSSEPWFDVGSFEAYLEATRTLVGDGVLKGDGATIDATRTEGSVVLGTGSVVRGSELRNVVLFEGCAVEDCMLEDCVLDDGCLLRGIDLRGKMLRTGTVLTRQ